MARRATDWSRIRADIGGRWLGYRPAWLVIAPLWIVISLVLTPGALTVPTGYWLLFANTIGVAAAFAVLLGFNATAFRNSAQRPVPVAMVLAAGAFLGATKAFVTNVALARFEGGHAIDSAGLLGRVILLAVMGAWLLPTTSIVLAVRERIEGERDELVRERIRARFAHAATTPVTSEVEPVDTLVNDFITEVQQQVRNAPDAGTLAEHLNDLVDYRLRPLSKLMWQQEQRRVPRLHFASLARMMYRSHQFATVPTLIGYVILFVGPQIAYAGLATGLARTAVQLAIIAVVFEISKRIPQTTAALGATGYFAINLLLPLALNEVSSALFGAIPGYSAPASYLLLALYFVISSLVFGIFRAAATERASIAREVELLADQQAALRFTVDEAQFRRNDLAHFLHSHVQNGMLNLALRLNEDGSRPVSPEERRLVETLLTDLAQFSSPQSTESLVDGLTEIAQRWQGFVALTTDNSLSRTQSAALSPHIVRSILQVINESITNAVRHGDAATIHLTLFIEADLLVVQCGDDGRGPQRETQPGLGSALFDSVAGSRWSLTRAAGTTLLDARIPLRE